MNWFFLGVGFGAGYAIMRPVVRWLRDAIFGIRLNRCLGWRVNLWNYRDYASWERLDKGRHE